MQLFFMWSLLLGALLYSDLLLCMDPAPSPSARKSIIPPIALPSPTTRLKALTTARQVDPHLAGNELALAIIKSLGIHITSQVHPTAECHKALIALCRELQIDHSSSGATETATKDIAGHLIAIVTIDHMTSIDITILIQHLEQLELALQRSGSLIPDA